MLVLTRKLGQVVHVGLGGTLTLKSIQGDIATFEACEKDRCHTIQIRENDPAQQALGNVTFQVFNFRTRDLRIGITAPQHVRLVRGELVNNGNPLNETPRAVGE